MKIEQIDDLRQAWQSMGEEVTGLATELRNLQEAWNTRRHRMLRRFMIECGVSFLIYATAIALIIGGDKEASRKIFGLKTVLLSLVFFIPFTVSFFKTIRQLSEKNTTESMGSFIHRSIQRLRRLRKVYLAGNYLFGLLLLAAFWFDPFLSQQPLWLRLSCYGVDVALMLLAIPLWNYSYGLDLKHFERMEREWVGE